MTSRVELRLEIERAFRTRPNAVAIADSKSSLTYRQLHREVAKLPHRLGVRKVDWTTKDVVHFVRCLLDDRPALLIDGSRHRTVDAESFVSANTQAAYGTFSTGTVTNGDLVRWVSATSLAYYQAGLLERLGLGGGPASFASCTPLWFDLAYTALFGALATGGTFHYLGPTEYVSPRHMARELQERRPDFLKITPSLFDAVFGATRRLGNPVRSALIFGGEALPWSVAKKVKSGQIAPQSYNHYGPAETTIGAYMKAINLDDRARLSSLSVPIGRPLPNVEGRVGGTWAGRGSGSGDSQSGELLLGGQQVVSNQQIGLHTRSGWYATGDIVRILDDGDLEFVGRLDRSVKIAGLSVNLGQVELISIGVPGVIGARARRLGRRLHERIEVLVTVPPGLIEQEVESRVLDALLRTGPLRRGHVYVRVEQRRELAASGKARL